MDMVERRFNKTVNKVRVELVHIEIYQRILPKQFTISLCRVTRPVMFCVRPNK